MCEIIQLLLPLYASLDNIVRVLINIVCLVYCKFQTLIAIQDSACTYILKGIPVNIKT